MAPQPPKTGHKCKLYRNTGTTSTPVWVLVAEIGDVSVPDFEYGTATLKRRANNFAKNLPTLIDVIAVEFRFHSGLDATNFDAMLADFTAGTPREWAVMDALIATVGAQGLRLPAMHKGIPFDQNLEDVVGHDVRLECAYMVVASAEVDPNWYVAA